MNINRVDHICIAVRDPETARQTWEKLLGKSGPDGCYQDDEAKARAVIYMVGETGIELMQDGTGDVATATGMACTWTTSSTGNLLLHTPSAARAAGQPGGMQSLTAFRRRYPARVQHRGPGGVQCGLGGYKRRVPGINPRASHSLAHRGGDHD